ncbi:MAG: 50S ribosomal protein L23 [Candidatus Schekmanbacteria bacterium RIFCSPHIGHO2_02_FULL_38_11]|uniref:Large ribosomal subunit protein uL23 n=1 Tax=Candidatus Schekmanbacteria bacterium RIFCSPLOWO2_12_FULL_38_15 TaxID=1817883 RepID=A0A1F7SN83_9BACT|nr:MAG: 50S ribosomal protein L23 [Candidatus Schekmanbacteria bacterium GWA2_38_9]OGL50064.1 MAG: 50S ribosomal protein L23 [Candidatus Schekmanbacteria bacterium RIFCSPLOWO2_02_FULL_38_14]OGL50506.1 MAG: 50S ribosomal protein L23 [Candidatus Schekmanbacteria bacterium RIFCSPHIGHO2_02_FULL_38_11]OGL54664.1 MAG: 50S ribosomal protein L23 [Candidatus Schekmanbacteria bacterium RIFCSPLOWO2_12_FULL_38_15]
MKLNPHNIIKSPIVTEKSNIIKDSLNKVVFAVDKGANKVQVKNAVQYLFKVKIDRVHLMNVKGKTKNFGRFHGKRPDWKKAIITLKEGEKIELFEGA